MLSGVDLKVEPGERHAIIGPNGAGKTTLFNIITGTYRPSAGKVYFKGRDVTGLAPHALSRLGIGRSFQITSTFGRLTEGRTVVLIEHDMDAVFSLADRITVLHRGEILATGTPAEIRANEAVKEAYLGEMEF